MHKFALAILLNIYIWSKHYMKITDTCSELHVTYSILENWNTYRYIPIINRTVSGLKGLHVPFDSANPNSSALMNPLLSRSTLKLGTTGE